MQCLMSLHQTLQGNERKAKSPARHREAYRSRLVRLGYEVMEDRVLLSAALPDYHFTTPALVTGTTQHNAPSSIGAFTKTPGATTQRIVSNGSIRAVLPAAPSFTATAVSATQINLAWPRVAGATGYLVDEWINGVWKQIGSLGSGSTGFAVTGLSPNTTYYFDVAAYNAAGATWAKYQFATTPAIKPCPWVIDHPGATGTYEVFNGTLFGPTNSPVFTDVHQGHVGDCWLMSALAEAAARAPQDITRMFTDLGVYMENGVQVHVWSVHFYDATGTVKSVLVDNELPADANNLTIYDQLQAGVLWAALAEKAYVEAAALGYVTVGNTTFNNYQNINDGNGTWSLHAITGQQPSCTMYVNPGDLNTVFNAGDLVVIRTTDNPASSLVPYDHYNAVIADNLPGNWPYEIYNPWGDPSNSSYYGSIFYANASFLQQNYNVTVWDHA